jgi:hypothetical protein
MTSSHTLLIEEEKMESFRAWIDSSDDGKHDVASKLEATEAAMKEGFSMLEGLRELNPEIDRNELLAENGFSIDNVKISEKAEQFLNAMKHMKARKSQIAQGLKEPVKPGDEFYMLQKMIEYMMGEKVKIYDPSESRDDHDDKGIKGHHYGRHHGRRDIDEIKGVEVPLSEHAKGEAPEAPENVEEGEALERVGWGVEYQSREVYHESEQTTFASSGVVKTADGREISFTLDLEMSREFTSITEESMRAGDALLVDPLVINFSGTAAELTDRKFFFDLDSDGTADSISFVSPGSGILAFDRNGDGIINNGSELFGPSTGNGFLELASFDEDGNGWIDAGDSIYSKLMVWSKDYEGNDSIYSLKNTGVGAIYLQSADTLFNITDSNNTIKGQVATTGIYLAESDVTGDITPGIIQQVNLVV